MPDIEELIRQLREYVGPFTAMQLMEWAADVIEDLRDTITRMDEDG